jgi:hypothetical protein
MKPDSFHRNLFPSIETRFLPSKLVSLRIPYSCFIDSYSHFNHHLMLHIYIVYEIWDDHALYENMRRV